MYDNISKPAWQSEKQFKRKLKRLAKYTVTPLSPTSAKVTGGERGDHIVTYINGFWQCDCVQGERKSVCVHEMAVQAFISNVK